MRIVAAAVLWGTAGTAGTFAAAGSVSLAAARLVIGGAVLALLFVRTRALSRDLLFGAACVAAYQLCFFAAVDRTGVAIGTVVAIGSGPIFTGLLSWTLDRTAPSGRWLAATVAAVAGCAVLVLGGGDGGAEPGGVALALLGGLLYATYAVTAARAIDRGVGSDTVMGTMFGGAAVLMLPVLLLSGADFLATPSGLLTALYLGAATTALAYVLYGRGLRTTPVATAATLALAEPAVAALLGVAVLSERLAPLSWAGLALLAAGLIVAALPERRVPLGSAA
ncbi:transporter [Acrocarpospora phusangensis]|uniref:Transporter n=1 Tax=Acrocarpospora phusangensis TaxID=1070424 RepID=A0A919Q4U3_9ACTN|nr:EamA family transporter [Acrocarpospora phusangensis]GIH22379.1 transporter [Acrocarpospora phusangensis]